MGIALLSIGGLFSALGILLFFEASRAHDPFAMSFAMDLATIAAVLVAGGAVVKAIDKLRAAKAPDKDRRA